MPTSSAPSISSKSWEKKPASTVRGNAARSVTRRSGQRSQSALTTTAVCTAWPKPCAEIETKSCQTPRDFLSSEKVKSKYDKTSDETTESVLVQSQQYSVTKKRPGATFNFTYRGQARLAVPSTVGLVVQVTEPQEFQGNAGSYTAGENVIELPTPDYASVNANFGTNHVLTFQIPIADYSRMLTASEAKLTVGEYDIPLDLGAIESMRDLGSRMWSGG